MSVCYDKYCSACTNLLSIFPIFKATTASPNLYCGRWKCREATFAQKCVRSVTHEKIFEKRAFPCAYYCKGCRELLVPRDLEKHEEICKYGFVEDKDACPGWFPEIFQYNSVPVNFPFVLKKNVTQDQNYQCMFTPERVFSISRNETQFHILTTDQSDRFATFTSLSDSFNDFQAEFAIKILEIGKDPTCSKQFRLSIIHESLIKTQIDIAVTNVIPVNLVEDEWFKFRINIVKIEHSNLTECFHEIGVQSLDQDLLNMLKCELCESYFRANIYQCLEGHSFCERCFQGLKSCMICSKNLDKRRNLTLENVIEFVTFPCKNSQFGCDFVGRMTALDRHVCPFAPKLCVFSDYSDCIWTYRNAGILPFHIKDEHAESTFECGDIMKIDRCFFNSVYKSCRASLKMWFSGRGNVSFCLFLLHILCEGKTFYWALESQVKDVMIKIDICDKDNKSKMMFRKMCLPFSGNNIKENACVIVDLNVIEPFCDDELCYRVDFLDPNEIEPKSRLP